MAQEGSPVFEASEREPTPFFEVKIPTRGRAVTSPELYFVLKNKDIIYIYNDRFSITGNVDI